MKRQSQAAILCLILALASCGAPDHQAEFATAREQGLELVEAIRRGDGAVIHPLLEGEWAAATDPAELSRELEQLRVEHGALDAPALVDVKALSAEDRAEGAGQWSEAIEVYAAMLTDGTGRSGARGVDVTLRLVREDAGLRLAEWRFVPLFDGDVR